MKITVRCRVGMKCSRMVNAAASTELVGGRRSKPVC